MIQLRFRERAGALETRRALFRRLGLAAVAALLSVPAVRPSGAAEGPRRDAAKPDLDLVDGWVLRADDRAFRPEDGAR